MSIKQLLDNNLRWAQTMAAQQPDLLPALAQGQQPKYLWLGCSDSRVPANQVLDLLPGELFVHRNIANQVQADDINCKSVIQYAVDVLRVEHIIVCGHYGCGGVKVALDNAGEGSCAQWLDSLKASCVNHRAELSALQEDQQLQRMCEINVIDQVQHLSENVTVQGAWSRQQALQIHGWVYNLEDGIIKDLQISRCGE